MCMLCIALKLQLSATIDDGLSSVGHESHEMGSFEEILSVLQTDLNENY